MALELLYGANFRCLLNHFPSLARLHGSWGQLWPKTGPKQQKAKTRLNCHDLAVLNMILILFLAPPPPGGPGGGSGLPFSQGNLRFWADSGPNPGIFNFLVWP